MTDGGTLVRCTGVTKPYAKSERDMIGGLIAVKEYSGTGSYTLDATTTYKYDILDLLTMVMDVYSKQTTMVYDSLGGKTSMTDLTMGAWSYVYDVNGNLTSQTDARSQTINFTYVTRSAVSQERTGLPMGATLLESMVYGYDQAGTGYANGKGQRTSMS
jgi:uncharacterized protein RhaS with RHS repeats